MRQKARDILFYLGILCELVVSFSGYAFGGYKESIIIVVGMVFFSLSICMDLEIKKMWPWYLVLGILGIAFYYFQKQALILRIVLALLAGRKQDIKKVVKVFFWGTLAVTVVRAVLALLHVTGEFYVEGLFRNEEERRYQFGYLHPNAFAFFWFRIYLMGLYVYTPMGSSRRDVRVLFYPVALLMLFPLYLAHSKTALFLGGSAFVAFLLCDLIRWKGFRTVLYAVGNLIMAAEFWLIYSFMTWLFPLEKECFQNKFWWKANYLTTGRNHMIHKLYENVKPSWIGSNLGSDATEVGIVNALYNQGIAFIILYIILVFFVFTLMYRRKNMAGMIFVIAFTAYASAEAFVPYFNKNGVWLMLIGLGLSYAGKKEKIESNQSK